MTKEHLILLGVIGLVVWAIWVRKSANTLTVVTGQGGVPVTKLTAPNVQSLQVTP